MTNLFKRGMAEATALTRAGKLQEATAMIRSLLLPAANPAEAGTAPNLAAPDVIEGDFVEVQPATAPKPAPKPAPDPKPATGPAKKTAPKPAEARSGGASGKATRTPLVETLRKIAAGGMPARGPLATAQAPVADGAQFLSLSHTSSHGSRAYRLYVPANVPATPMPLIVMLHGCTQTPEDFAIGTGMNALADEFGCLIAYPAQPSGANAQKCWNWFRPEDQGRDRGEPALIAGLTRDIQRHYPADPARTYVAGLSAGGAAAATIAAAYPDVFAAVGVHSGLPAGAARDVGSAFAAMRSGTTVAPHAAPLPTIVLHGLADSTVHPSNGAASVAQALPAMPGLQQTTRRDTGQAGRPTTVTAHHHPDGRTMAEHWQIDGAGHAWAGGNPGGSYTDPAGPDASRQILRFFLQHART